MLSYLNKEILSVFFSVVYKVSNKKTIEVL